MDYSKKERQARANKAYAKAIGIRAGETVRVSGPVRNKALRGQAGVVVRIDEQGCCVVHLDDYPFHDTVAICPCYLELTGWSPPSEPAPSIELETVALPTEFEIKMPSDHPRTIPKTDIKQVVAKVGSLKIALHEGETIEIGGLKITAV